MKKMMTVLVSGLALILCATGCQTVVVSQTTSLYYRGIERMPMQNVGAKLSSVEVVSKVDGNVIGVRYHEDHPTQTYDVTTLTDVTTWVQSAVKHTLTQSCVELGDSKANSLRITVEQLQVNEKVSFNAVYKARIVLTAELIAPGGKVVHTQRIHGDAGNYGRPGNQENYWETCNHALDKALLTLFSDGSFRSSVVVKN